MRSLIEEAHQCLTIVERDASKPNPLTELYCVLLLIESEMIERNAGRMIGCVHNLQHYKNQITLSDAIKNDSIHQQIEQMLNTPGWTTIPSET